MTIRKLFWCFSLFLFSVVAGCTKCHSIECNGGFELTMPLPGEPNWDIGEYSLDFKIDQHSLTVICPVEQEIRWARCTITGDVPDELGLSCNMRLIAIDPNDSQSAATGGIVCNTEYYDDSLSVRGPENVNIVVKREGKIIGSSEYEPEYTRNNNYWGDEECGYCESLVSETLTLQSSN